MKRTDKSIVLRLVCGGVCLFILRMAQNLTGFDPETGLAVPTLPGKLLPWVLLALFALEFLTTRKLSKEKADFETVFAAPNKSTTAVIVGSMLLMAGGLLTALAILPAGVRGAANIAAVAAAGLAVFTGAGLLVLTRKLRDGQPVSAAALLPGIFFGVFFVLAMYLPHTADPVLGRWYLPVLAAAMCAFAFAQLAGFTQRDSSPRSFAFPAETAVMTSIAAAADGSQGQVLLFCGCALILGVFLVLQAKQQQ